MVDSGPHGRILDAGSADRAEREQGDEKKCATPLHWPEPMRRPREIQPDGGGAS